MGSKNLKSLNQKILQIFRDWIQYLPVTWLKSLTPLKFSEQTDVSISESEDFFDSLLYCGLAEAKINMNCPFCSDEVTVSYKLIKEDFVCDNCEQTFIPEKYCLNGDVLYKINKEDFNDTIQSARMPQINRLLKNHPLDAENVYNKDNIIFLNNNKELYREITTSDSNSILFENRIPQKYNTRTKVFISYSHADNQYLIRLKVHLKQLERDGKVNYWDDTKIKTGQLWKEEIKNAIKAAKVAVLLISPDFLASDFIADKELPLLLKAAEEEGTIILPVIISPCRFTKTESISCFQAVNSPDRTVIQMDKAEQEQMWVKLTEDIAEALT